MNEYRKEVSDIARETRWTFFTFLPISGAIVVIIALLGFGLNSLGLFGEVYVERKVFETSYQRQESLKAEIAANEAALAEIEANLANPNLDNNTRYNLKAQATAASIRIKTARSRLK